MGGLEATKEIRKLEERLPSRNGHTPRTVALNGRIPVIAVTASLPERERHTIIDAGLGELAVRLGQTGGSCANTTAWLLADGWLLKPLNVQRLRTVLKGTVDAPTRTANVYR